MHSIKLCCSLAIKNHNQTKCKIDCTKFIASSRWQEKNRKKEKKKAGYVNSKISTTKDVYKCLGNTIKHTMDYCEVGHWNALIFERKHEKKKTQTSTKVTEALHPVVLVLVHLFLQFYINIKAWNSATILAGSSQWDILRSFRNWKLIKAKATAEKGKNLKGQYVSHKQVHCGHITCRYMPSSLVYEQKWNGGYN